MHKRIDLRSRLGLLDGISDAFLSVDRNWQITYLNREAARINVSQPECSPHDAIGRNLWDFLSFFAGTRFEQEFRRAMNEHTAVHFDEVYAASGVWLECHVYASEGGLSILLCDVTNKKREEQLVRTREGIFRHMAEALEDVFWIADIKEKRLLYVNPASRRVWGVAPDSVGVDFLLSLHGVHSEDRPVVEHAFRQLFTTAIDQPTRPAAVEYRVVSPEVETRWIRVRAFPTFTLEGTTFSSCVVAWDITNAKNSEAAKDFMVEASGVFASSLDYRKVVRSMADLAVPQLAECCIVYLWENGNLEFREAAHVDPEKLDLIKQVERRFPPRRFKPSAAYRAACSNRCELIREVTQTFLRENAQDSEHLRLLGQLELKSVLIVPITGGQQISGSILLGSGSRMFAEPDATRALEFGRSAGKAIENALLYLEAQHAIGARDNTIAIVSHDLRNPLNTIGLSVHYLLQHHRLDAVIENSLRMINRATSRMERMIQDLLDLSAIEAGRVLPIAPRPVLPAKLISEVAESMGPQMEEKALELESHVNPALPAVMADPEQIMRALQNLLGNALKFTPSGGRITIGAEQAGEEVQFHVQDTGQGIPERDLSRIFEPFWQARRNAPSGIGLGLPIVRGIIEGHNGKIWAQSKTGLGSTFYFTLPVANGDDSSLAA